MEEEKNNDQIHAMRHSLAHIMAAAVQEMFPEVKFGIGPVIDNGFYYDFDLPRTLQPEDLPLIEEKMNKLVAEKIPFRREEISKADALAFFEKANEPYKIELINELEDGTITLYRSGKFIDLCKGPHVDHSGQVGVFKLTHIAGAYWRGDEHNKMLQRIYAVAFKTQAELDAYMQMMEEAKKRDHRKLGKDLDLFVHSDLVGKGLPLFTKKGATIRRELERFIIDEEIRRGYEHVTTPELAHVQLYEKSGHYPYYKDTMYPAMEVDNDKLILRPMTCPHHFQIYADKLHSYKDLPLKIAEPARLYRYEKSGELTGLIRLRSFCLADSHIFCRVKQAKKVIKEVIDLIEYANGVLGFQKGIDYSYRLSLGDRSNEKKYYKDDKSWEKAEIILKEVLDELKSPYVAAQDEAAFYGPKIDIQMKNVLGKEDTAFTVQYDFCLPRRFDLKFINEKGQEEMPIVIHRSSIGCIERTMAYLIEKFAGIFPLWLAPTQVIILPVSSERHLKHCKKIQKKLVNKGFRVELDDANDSVGKKIRNAQLQKVNYMMIVGDRDIENDTVSIRPIQGEDLGAMKLADFIKMIKVERDKKIIKNQ